MSAGREIRSIDRPLTTGLAFLMALLLILGAGAAVAAESGASVPSNFKRHQERYWVWYAPHDWIASSGKYDLNISSPTGTLWNKYGAGGVVCPATASKWFRSLRNNYRDTAKAGSGLYSRRLFAARFTSVGRTRQIGNLYYRQKVRWAGRQKSGRRIKGEMIMDVFVVDQFSGVCGQRFQVRGAPARGNKRSLSLLRKVQSTITSRNL